MITIGVAGENHGGGINDAPIIQLLQHAGKSSMGVKTYPLSDMCLRGMEWNIHSKEAWCIRRAREVVSFLGKNTLEAMGKFNYMHRMMEKSENIFPGLLSKLGRARKCKELFVSILGIEGADI